MPTQHSRFLGLALAIARYAFAGSSAAPTQLPHYNHVFLMVEENHGYKQIIGNPAAPNINSLAATYGLATAYYSVADPSEPNYVAMLGGDFFGLNSDNPYYTNTVGEPSLMTQLEAANLTWKGYFQGMPYAGYRGICYPRRCNGIPDFDTLYASKHNGMVNFASIQSSESELDKMVPFGQLRADLHDDLPNFVYIIPDECHDMHGAPPWCVDSGGAFGPQDQHLVTVGDSLVGEVVAEIMASPHWTQGNNAIVITFDEGNGTAGCCDAVPGTGQVATVVITNNGPRGLQDSTPYNHYSMLQTFEMVFGLGCLQFACDTVNVTPMAPLFAVEGGAK